MTPTPITEKEIRGITWKQIAGIVVVVGLAVLTYTDVKSMSSSAYKQSKENNDILKEIQNDRKESERVNNIRLTNIELDQREAKIRLTNLEQR